MSYEKDIKASLKKYGEQTMCPYCGWSLLELGHSLKECEKIADERNSKHED